jgi:hypothetical protein
MEYGYKPPSYQLDIATENKKAMSIYFAYTYIKEPK